MQKSGKTTAARSFRARTVCCSEGLTLLSNDDFRLVWFLFIIECSFCSTIRRGKGKWARLMGEPACFVEGCGFILVARGLGPDDFGLVFFKRLLRDVHLLEVVPLIFFPLLISDIFPAH